jgi:hypothetical protein
MNGKTIIVYTQDKVIVGLNLATKLQNILVTSLAEKKKAL